MAFCILNIALDTPLNSCFDYRWPCEPGAEPLVGQLALVSFARREVVGLIVGISHSTDVPPEKLKDALAVRSQLAPLSDKWLALAAFAADYYQRPLGEVALPGQYPYVAQMTAEKAVAIAGGFTPRAWKHEFKVTRMRGGQLSVGKVPPTYPLQPGDTLHVAERWF